MIVLSVLGNLSLALVTATMSFRIYKSVLAAVNKTNEGHPFKVSESSDRPAKNIQKPILATKFVLVGTFPTALNIWNPV